ncbi:PAS domain-containing hybrid sensor histidine kinase/response regulator [Tropicibacter oceani]|uniref:histidine kinase n=1 Tax=Tropicibacter oceani TaxID=3058420 RepID=A0ABY8QKI5_9RHOB|nr:PAS domain-containing hybrid sensor histidine kinase/response regulator [Tropicibacter oceani]WGW04332.1 response regulator [Tropicibacter oceani]
MPAQDGSDATNALDAFEARYGRSALFERYARSRIGQFWLRLVCIMIGATYLWVFFSPAVASFGLAFALLGDVVELTVLQRARGWNRAGMPIGKVYLWTTLAGAVQGASVAAGILLLIVGAPSQDVELVGLCLLMAASVNAGFSLTHHPPVSRVKLAIFATIAAGFLWEEVVLEAQADLAEITHILEIALLTYLTYTFVNFSVRSWNKRLGNEKALIEAAERLNKANKDLADHQREMRELSLVARHANDSVILFDPEMTITWVNEAFTRLTGYSREEAVGQKPWVLLSGPETSPLTGQALEKAVRDKTPFQTRLLNYSKSGEKIWFDINRVPVKGPDGEVETLISIERDVTEIQKHEQVLAQASVRAEEGARAKSIFLATMSHEMRTPLNAILGMADLLADGDLGDEQNEYVSTIQSASTSLLALINDVLDFSRLEAGKVEFENAPLSPAETVQDAAQMLRTMAREKGVFLDVAIKETLPKMALADAGRIRQILINLIGNAVKFTDTGGVTVTAEAAENTAGWRMRVVVRDTGIGVPEDRAEHIFGEFQQADAATTRRFGGTGLGLPISRALAQRMGGNITLLPQPPDGGSAFEMTVQLHHPRAGAAPVQDSHGAVHLDLATKLRVLVAEDNATNRLLVARFLKNEPVTLSEARNGREALEMIIDELPDVVFMDMSMPELDGLEVTRMIRALDIPQPFIAALTANAFESDRAACAAAGMDDFVTKPLRRQHLIAALLRATRGEKPLSQTHLDGVSRPGAERGTEPWTSPPASGTTNGKSIRSSGR